MWKLMRRKSEDLAGGDYTGEEKGSVPDLDDLT
jgi:hypothetical protein